MSAVFPLQSGFVTAECTELARPQPGRPGIKEQIIQDIKTAPNVFYYDEGVERLYQLWRNDNSLMSQFEFREKVLKAALRVFCTKGDSLGAWIFLQLDQPSVGYLQRRFIREMVNRATGYDDKTMENDMYYRLLRAQGSNEVFNTTGENVSEVLANYVNKNQSASIRQLLEDWTRNMNGFCDLLMSLHVIFGRRPLHDGENLGMLP